MLFLGVGVPVLDLEVGEHVVLITIISVLAGLIEFVLGNQIRELDALVLLEIVLGGLLGVFVSLEGFLDHLLGDLLKVHLAVFRDGASGLLATLAPAGDQGQSADQTHNQNKKTSHCHLF